MLYSVSFRALFLTSSDSINPLIKVNFKVEVRLKYGVGRHRSLNMSPSSKKKLQCKKVFCFEEAECVNNILPRNILGLRDEKLVSVVFAKIILPLIFI